MRSAETMSRNLFKRRGKPGRDWMISIHDGSQFDMGFFISISGPTGYQHFTAPTEEVALGYLSIVIGDAIGSSVAIKPIGRRRS
jgi:hypothetical protein